jgi:hypothetical protein
MEQNIFPVDVISVCSAAGMIRPLRVRMESDSHQILRIDIDQIISVRHIQYVGIEAQIFLCRGMVSEKELLFELQYTIRTHTWHMLRKVY